MGYFEKLLNINKMKDSMLDEKSRILFDARIDYMITRNADQFYNIVDNLENDWHCSEVDEIMKKTNTKGIIIFGAGHDGRRTKRILENCNYFPKYFCDSNMKMVGEVVEKLEVLSVDNLLENYRDYLIVLGSSRYAEEMYQFLQMKKFPAENILYPRYNLILAERGKQYFDVFSVDEGETFIDGGAYNGDTILDFVSWTKGKYNKIYVFEPLEKMYQCVTEKIEKGNINNIELYKNALWSNNQELYFVENEAGSNITETGKSVVKGIALDNIVKEERVTFIKMDIEGSELNALRGAKDIIIKDKPKLAICIYHKPEDIIDLTEYILSLVPEYKFYIRHYSSRMWETVLYAIVNTQEG